MPAAPAPAPAPDKAEGRGLEGEGKRKKWYEFGSIPGICAEPLHGLPSRRPPTEALRRGDRENEKRPVDRRTVHSHRHPLILQPAL